jgi:ABC-type antimicrobial peptide transport system permease subunit
LPEVEMNRSLLIFSVLLILLGFVLGAILISIFGFFLLFPALLSSPRPRPQGTPTGSGKQAPEPAPVMETAPEPDRTMATTPEWGKLEQVGTVARPVMPRTVAAASTPSLSPSQPLFSAPLFPTSIFPSASQQMPAAQALNETKREAPYVRDEVLELGALLALMKLVFG